MKLVFLLVIALAALVSAQQPGTAAERAAMREEQHPAHYAAVRNFRLADASHSSSRLTRSTSRVNAHGHRQPHADELSLSFDTADGRSYAFTLLADHQLCKFMFAFDCRVVYQPLLTLRLLCASPVSSCSTNASDTCHTCVVMNTQQSNALTRAVHTSAMSTEQHPKL
jgi:hypothetical protein